MFLGHFKFYLFQYLKVSLATTWTKDYEETKGEAGSGLRRFLQSSRAQIKL